MTSDVAEDRYEGSTTASNVLDLSGAFGVTDHPMVLKRLEFSLNVIYQSPNTINVYKWVFVNIYILRRNGIAMQQRVELVNSHLLWQ